MPLQPHDAWVKRAAKPYVSSVSAIFRLRPARCLKHPGIIACYHSVLNIHPYTISHNVISMVSLSAMSEFNTTDFAAQMRGFEASDEARQKLFAVSHSLHDLGCPHLIVCRICSISILSCSTSTVL